MTYPLKFRKKVLRVREKEGLSIAAVAARFDVGVAQSSLHRALGQLGVTYKKSTSSPKGRRRQAAILPEED